MSAKKGKLTLKFRVSTNFNIRQNKTKLFLAIRLFKMASKLGKFERTFVVCEFVVTTTKFLQKLVVNRTTAANFFPPNFVALLSHVTGMRTKVQMIDFVVVVVVVVGSKGLYSLV